MLRTLTTVALALTLSAPAAADVLIETSPDPLPEQTEPITAKATAPDLQQRTNVAASDWFIPRFRVDRTKYGDTTLLAVRAPASVRPCDGETCDYNVEVIYNDVHRVRQHTDRFNLSGHQVQTINVRDVPGLATDPDGFARGMIRIVTVSDMNVDYFQVDTSRNLATGGEALDRWDFCETWAARFLTFGSGQGTVLSIFVLAPMGAEPTDPPTVMGSIYNQSGTFINSFTIRTDECAFDLRVQDVVHGSTQFGTAELALFSNTDFPGGLQNGGLVTVSHAAENRFSIGGRAFCTD